MIESSYEQYGQQYGTDLVFEKAQILNSEFNISLRSELLLLTRNSGLDPMVFC